MVVVCPVLGSDKGLQKKCDVRMGSMHLARFSGPIMASHCQRKARFALIGQSLVVLHVVNLGVIFK